MSVHRIHADHARLVTRISGPANTAHEERLQEIYDSIQSAARRGSTMVEFIGSESMVENDLISGDLHMNGFSVVALESLPPKISVCW